MNEIMQSEGLVNYKLSTLYLEYFQDLLWKMYESFFLLLSDGHSLT